MKITLSQREAKNLADSALRRHLPDDTCLEVELQNPLPPSLCRLHKGELTRLLSDFSFDIDPDHPVAAEKIHEFLAQHFNW
jgi:hypothetical protein